MWYFRTISMSHHDKNYPNSFCNINPIFSHNSIFHYLSPLDIFDFNDKA